MPAQGKFFFTPHSVNQYRARVHRGISYERALRELVQESARSHFVKLYNGGVEYWRGPRPMRLRFLVDSSGSGLPAVVTVLPAADAMIRGTL